MGAWKAHGDRGVPQWLSHPAGCLPVLGSGSWKEAGCQEAVVRLCFKQAEM